HLFILLFFFSSRRRHTRSKRDWSSDVCSSDLKNNKTIYPILFIISAAHLLNDSLQAVIPAMFPILEKSLNLSFTQLGFIAFTLNMIASVMQPIIGTYTDKKPTPFALPIG